MYGKDDIISNHYPFMFLRPGLRSAPNQPVLLVWVRLSTEDWLELETGDIW